MAGIESNAVNRSILRNTFSCLFSSSLIDASTGWATCCMVPEISECPMVFHLAACV